MAMFDGTHQSWPTQALVARIGIQHTCTLMKDNLPEESALRVAVRRLRGEVASSGLTQKNR
jgi:hypothetical protein